MEKLLKVTAVVALVMVTFAAAVFAGPPVDGTYKSVDQPGGLLFTGRSSVSWTGSPGGGLLAGNVQHVQSWDGTALGTQWHVSCPIVVSVRLIYDFASGGNGQKAYEISYGGGEIWLDGAGPWSGGDVSYTATVQNYVETRTLQFAGGILVGTTSNHAVSANIVGYPTGCVTFGVGNSAWIGDTDSSTKPADYPEFVDSGCSPGSTIGHWDDMTDLTLTIAGCALPVQEISWGSVKSLYHD